MSRSLAIVNGDLEIGAGRSMQLVSGKAKLLQDMKLWILERIGTDIMTPGYGSRLDGGIVNGIPIPSFIGQIVTDEMLSNIRAEVISLIEKYQAMQYDKLRNETLAYLGRNTLDEGEVIRSIESVSVRSSGTIVLVRVILNVLDGTQLKLVIPMGDLNA